MASTIGWSLRRGREASLCRPVIRCLHLPAHTAPVVHKRALTRRVTPDGSKQLALAPSPVFCWSVSPHLFILLWSPCWIVPPLTKPDSSLPADSCSPDQAAPGCMVVLRLFQRFNKCRKGRKVSVRCSLCAFRTFHVFRVFCDDKLSHLCLEGDVSRSDLLPL